MPIVTDLGRDGPHPDGIAGLVEQRVGSAVQIIQQRTLYNVSWSQSSRDGTITKSGMLDVSAGLAISAPQGRRRQLIGYAATRLPDRESWGVAQTDIGPIGNRLLQPLTGSFLAAHGIWVGVGGLVHWPRYVGRVRVTLADGQAFESIVSDRSFLVLAPCDSAQRWLSPMTVEYYNPRGRKIRTDPYDLSRPVSRS